MKNLVAAFVYTALTLGAIATTPAVYADVTAANLLREGDMKKLIFHDVPEAVPNVNFDLADEAGKTSMDAYQGKYILLNFWATWCAPCKKEMPQLSQLQTELGGVDFEVVTIATGRNSPKGIQKFFDEQGIKNLPRHQDPKQALASQMGIFGLPITVLIDPEGREIARMRGEADWSSENAKAVVAAVLGRDN